LIRQAAQMFADELPSMPVQHICSLLMCSVTETIVLIQKGEVVAAATARYHPGTLFVEIELLAVHRLQQRQGYGILLLQRLVKLTHHSNCRWLLASADDTAVPFFVGCGFSRKITIPKRVYSKVLTTYENALLVQLDLSTLADDDKTHRLFATCATPDDYPFLAS